MNKEEILEAITDNVPIYMGRGVEPSIRKELNLRKLASFLAEHLSTKEV